MPSIADWLGRQEAKPSLTRWQEEAEKHARAGDYAWMVERITPGRVLEIGCGAGFGTEALHKGGFKVLSLEPEPECIALTTSRCAGLPDVGKSGALPEILQIDVCQITDSQRAAIAEFAPAWVVCWMMGAADQMLNPHVSSDLAVQKYRETVHRKTAELAATLQSVTAVHLVDRTAFPWKIKETARETLTHYHQTSTFSGLPFKTDIKYAVYRKLDERQWPAPAGQRAMTGVVPVLGSLTAYRA